MSTLNRADVATTDAIGATPAAAADREVTSGVAPQRVLAGSGTELVNEAARAICGTGAKQSPSSAEGMALVGRRAASLLDETAPEPADVLEAGRAPWVYHHLADGSASRLRVGPVELVAGSHQAAVDHALAAHIIAEHVGLPVTCRIDRGLASTPGLAHFPVEAGIAELMAAFSGVDGATAPESGSLATIDELLRAIGQQLGRPLGALGEHHLEDAELRVVTLGSASSPALAAVKRLRSAGVRAGLVSLGVLRPLPRQALVARLSGARALALLETGGDGDSELFDFLTDLQHGETGAPALARIEVGDGHEDVDVLAGELAGLVGVERLTALKAVAAATPELALTVAAQPGGAWGRTLLLDLAATLGRATALRLTHRGAPDGLSMLTLGAPEASQPSTGGAADLLILPHPRALNARSAHAALRQGATLVIETETSDDASLWAAIDPPGRALIETRGLSLWRVDARGPGDGAEQPARAARAALVGAALQAMAKTAPLASLDERIVERVARAVAREEGDAERSAATWLMEGARGVTRVDVATARSAGDGPARVTRQLRMPAAPEKTSEAWRRELRRFHLNGERARGPGDPSLGLPLTPAALHPLLEVGGAAPAYPFYLPALDDPEPPSTLLSLLQTAAEAAGSLPIVGGRLPALARVAAAALANDATGSPRTVLGGARPSALDRFDVSDEGGKALAAELDAIEATLPGRGRVIGLDESAPLRLYLWAVRRARGPRLAAFAARARRVLEQIGERLLTDHLHDPAASSPDALSQAMGVGSDRFDASALSSALKPTPGTKRLSSAQRGRLQKARAVLERMLGHGASIDDVVVVHSDPLPDALDLPGVRVVRHGNPLAAAIGLFDGRAADWLDVFRALRTARLELEVAYDPTVHDALLAEFGWSSCTSEELALLPPVVAVAQSSRVHRRELAAFEQLLDAGRPVHALVLERTPGAPGGWPGELGRTAVAHGEAFVLQSSVVKPGHLVEGFSRMASVTRPALAVVAMPPADSTVPMGVVATAALEGRGTPCFRFDPDGGRDFADQFDVEGNPVPGRGWPAGVITCQDEASGEERTLDTVFTWADVASLHDACRGDFWVVPPVAWSDEQIELADLLARGDPSERRAVPYIWVVDADGRLQRAVVTRALMLRTFDRQRAWHALQELAGIDNAFARQAAETARAAAEAEAETQRAALETTLREEIEQVRTQAAGEAIDRLVAALLNLDTSAAAALVAPAVAPVAPAMPAAEPTAPADAALPTAEAEEEDEDLGFDEAYIDSFLCTTCDECTGINPVMFKYNAEKQAYLADITAGTFAELVDAAEKCPARCIHTGKPRAGDTTATDEVVQRAAKFS